MVACISYFKVFGLAIFCLSVRFTLQLSIITSLVVIFGVIFTIYRWYLKQEKQDKDIKDIKEEQLILTMGVLACLKGLKEQGCDGPVTDAIGRLEAHLNEQAHK